MFDIASVLAGAAVTASQGGREQITYLDPSLITPDNNNFYSMQGIEELAGNIELIGLQQPLRVRRAPQGEDYIVISGHRRREAILRILADRPDAFPDGVPCIIEDGAESEAMRELRLIYANAATRVMGSAEISLQAERVEALLYQLKEEGVEFPGRMRDHVAEACRVSKTKLARLHAIRNKLDPVLLGYFDRGELTETAAYELSRLPANIQAEAGQRLADGKTKRIPFAGVVEKVNRNLDRYMAEMPCRCHAGGPDCHHKEARIVRSLFANGEWNTCEPGQCCRDCYHWKDCSAACEETKARRKLEKDVEKEKQAERNRQERAEQELRKKAVIRELGRVLPLIEAKGLADGAELPSLVRWRLSGPKVESVRKMAAGDFGDAYFFHDENWLPRDVETLGKWADFFGCSLDYLAGRTADTRTAEQAQPVSGTDTAEPAGWSDGKPAAAGDYAVRCGVAAEEGPRSAMTRILHWDGEEWVHCGTSAPFRENVYRWHRLPEV